MTAEERFQLLHSIVPLQFPGAPPPPPGLKPTAGYVRGIARLNVPDLWESDASLGVSNPFMLRKDDVATALPSGLALAATFNAKLAYAGGAMIGAEARAKGFNVLLGGGVNLARDHYNGRNFEYLGEDPLLAGVLGGEAIRGIQSNGVISTVKHFSLNAQETLRMTANAQIGEAAHRESDLLAFQIAIERGQPGAVMCAYNQVNGAYACGNDHLLNGVLKGDWGYKGWVMSDWGAVHSASYFNAGLDQQSGAQLDKKIWFDAPLKAEVAEGRVSPARVSDAVRRILRSIYAVGADWPIAEAPIDYAANAKVARQAAAEGVVLLKNDGVLPLAAGARSILVVGGHADVGVMSGGGSSQVTPVGGPAAKIPIGGRGGYARLSQQVIMPSSPLKALKKALPDARIDYDSGYYHATAAARAAKADLVVVFANQWATEDLDATDFALPDGQDQLIAAVAKANPNTVVVLQTGNPVAMPWLGGVRGVVEAWYPGQEGGEAIADVLTGAVNPSGRLPITFPRMVEQTPRPTPPGLDAPDGAALDIDYVEGSNVGYRGFAARKDKPLFPFGFGMSFTRFAHGQPRIADDGQVRVSFEVKNIGERDGADAPQLYLVEMAGQPVRRLVGFDKVALKAGEGRTVAMTVDPRLLAAWEEGGWRVRAGTYRFAVGASSEDLGRSVSITLPERTLKP